jgi:hypothetical protein
VTFACASPLAGKVRRSIRSPGEKNAALPEEVWDKYECARRKLPFLRVESFELSPERIKAGEEFNHRWVYSLCPLTPTSVVGGRLETRIFFKGQPIVTDDNERFELKPGRWVIDTFVEVPPNAEPGVYSIEIRFVARSAKFLKRRTFAVQ